MFSLIKIYYCIHLQAVVFSHFRHVKVSWRVGIFLNPRKLDPDTIGKPPSTTRSNVWLFSFNAWMLTYLTYSFFFKNKSMDIYWFHLPLWVQLENDLARSLVLSCIQTKINICFRHFLFFLLAMAYLT